MKNTIAGNVDRGTGEPQGVLRGVMLATGFLCLLSTLCFLFTGSAAAEEPHEWRGFELAVPGGWDVAEASYSAGNSGIDSKVFYLRSMSGSRVLVAFIDGGERAEALAESSLMNLLETYLSSHFLRRERPLIELEPWQCRMGVADGVPVYGGHAQLDPDSMGHDGPTEAWACASRDFGAGLVLLTVGWAEGEGAAELVSSGQFPEFRRVLSQVGFSSLSDDGDSAAEEDATGDVEAGEGSADEE